MNKETTYIQNLLIESAGEGPEDDCAIDQTYDLLLILAQKKRFKTIDLLLTIISPKAISLDILLSILTVTSWCKQELRERDEFFKKASGRLDCMFNGMLEGLE